MAVEGVGGSSDGVKVDLNMVVVDVSPLAPVVVVVVLAEIDVVVVNVVVESRIVAKDSVAVVHVLERDTVVAASNLVGAVVLAEVTNLAEVIKYDNILVIWVVAEPPGVGDHEETVFDLA